MDDRTVRRDAADAAPDPAHDGTNADLDVAVAADAAAPRELMADDAGGNPPSPREIMADDTKQHTSEATTGGNPPPTLSGADAAKAAGRNAT